MEINSFPGLEGEVAWDPRPISRSGSERVIRFGFELAKEEHLLLKDTEINLRRQK